MHSTFSCSFTIPVWSSCLRISISFFRAFRVCSSFGICTAFTATSPPSFESVALKTTEKAPRPTVPMCLKRPFSYLSGKTSLASALQSVVDGPNMGCESDTARGRSAKLAPPGSLKDPNTCSIPQLHILNDSSFKYFVLTSSFQT